MMPSAFAASLPAPMAVSEYEHLNNASSWKETYRDGDSDEEDTIPFKPFRAPSVSQSQKASRKGINENNSNAWSTNELEPDLVLLQGNDELHLKPAHAVPVPINWSPIKSNPSLWLTPDKGSGTSAVSPSDKVLEPQDINKIPLPSAWSPGMMVRPDPSLFVTPEKTPVTKNSPVIKDNYVKVLSEAKENLGIESSARDFGVKEKHSVRFDLPPPSSGDETVTTVDDSFSDVGSPITIRGSETLSNSTSPQWKSFSPLKQYNPEAYSDESALDESYLNVNSAAKVTSISAPSQPQPSLTKPLPNTVKPGPSKTAQPGPKPTKKTEKICSAPTKGIQYIKSPYSQYDTNHPVPSVVREAKNKFISEDYSFPFEAGAVGGDAECEHVFARPEYNSTLRVRCELDTLNQQEVDVEKALQSTLASSELKRTEINEKASVYTNRASDQFSNLVNLDPSVEGLCDRIVRMRLSKAPKKKKSQANKKSTQTEKVPDLQEFFSPDLQHDSPDLSLPGVGPHSIRLMTAPEDVAFDLYRHNRVWNGINDF